MKNMMHTSVGEVSKAWHDILTMIRHDFPYFNRTNGRDHFSTSTFDQGRCHALTWVSPDLYGEMFFVMLNGDRLARTIHASVERNLQIIGYNYNSPVQPQFPDIPCYMPDRDIVVPAFIGDQMPIVSPFTGNRPIQAIFRFSAQQGHRAPLMHHGHDLRPELLSMYQKQRIKGWSLAAKGENQTNKEHPLWSRLKDVPEAAHPGVELRSQGGESDEQGVAVQRLLHLPVRPLPVDQPPLQASQSLKGENATNKEWQLGVFCICPPGHSWWTSSPFKALISGCIPVTFFRDHDNPWGDEVDYSAFSINIDPDDIASLRYRLETAPVEQLQRGVEKMQYMFKWSRTHTWGAEYELLKRLRQRGKQLSSTALFL
ncbi:unnamed protein product [Closterium sp. Naga37s-1]|nr:unnamed protein product [Closterium sp. Naga37s-1]